MTKIPANGRVMVCQVHGIYPNGDNGPVPLKVIYEGNKKRLALLIKHILNHMKTRKYIILTK